MEYRAEKDRQKEKVGGRPAKLNERKGDRGLEWEIKNNGDIYLLGEQHENFVVAVTKWEMLAATNAKWKWTAVKKKGGENTYDIFPIKRVTNKFLEVSRECSRANNGKEMYKKSVLHVQSCFFC